MLSIKKVESKFTKKKLLGQNILMLGIAILMLVITAFSMLIASTALAANNSKIAQEIGGEQILNNLKSEELIVMETENKNLMNRFVEQVLRQKQIEKIDVFLAPDFFEHNRNGEAGRESFKDFFASMFKAFPDLDIQVDQIMADKDKVLTYSTWTGTHTGTEFRGVQPTGNKFTMRSADMYRVVNGQLSELWDIIDSTDFQKQLGLLNW